MGPGPPAAKHKNVISLMNMVKALQEELGRELLERIAWFNELRAAVEVGVNELDAGLGEELDIEELISEFNEENGGRDLL
jgi:hypothetical protein